MDFTRSYEILACGDPVAAGSSIDSNSDIIDMAGYQSATFICPITDSVATGVASLTVEQNDAESDTWMSALSDTLAVAVCAVNDDLNGKLLVVEVRRPQKRYIQAVRTSLTANIAFGPLIAILGKPVRKLPVTDPALNETIADLVLANEPDEV